jgi:capsular polysaccharide biosynthesis protein
MVPKQPGQGASLGDDGDEQVLPLRDIAGIVRRRLWVVLLTLIVIVGATVGYSLTRTPEYEASIEILVGQRQGNEGNYSLGSDVQGLQQLTQTLAKAVSSRPLAEAVIRRTDLRTSPEEFLAERLRAQQVPDTQFIQVTYRDSDPQRARRVADTIGEVFSRQVSEISGDNSGVTATVWEPAAVPSEPVSPDVPLNVLLALVLGSVAGLGLAFLVEYRDNSWRSPEEVEQVSGVPAFGIIPNFAAAQGRTRKVRGGR